MPTRTKRSEIVRLLKTYRKPDMIRNKLAGTKFATTLRYIKEIERELKENGEL